MDTPWFGDHSPIQPNIESGTFGKNLPIRASLRALGDEMTTIRDALSKTQVKMSQTPTRTLSKDSLISFTTSSPSNLTKYSKVEDLIHMSGPLTEDAIVKTLQGRFAQEKYYTRVGPCLIALNPHSVSFPSLALVDSANSTQLHNICQDAIQQLLETGHSQSLILSGRDSSGKSYNSQLLMRELIDMTDTGKDMLKHIQSALTVLRPLTHTHGEQGSSHMGLYTQLIMEHGTVMNFKLTPLFCGMDKVGIKLDSKPSFEILYLIISGLSEREKAKFHLENYAADMSVVVDKSLKRSFGAWKTCLSEFGIHFADMMRILAAVTLLSNVSFQYGDGSEPDVYQPNNELKSVAALLGISVVTLYRCLTSTSTVSRGERIKNILSPEEANRNKESLCKTLYVRMVKSVIQRIGVFLNSKQALQSDQKSGGDVFVGVLDFFGFQFGDALSDCGLESLCKNLCVETLQQHYTTMMFRNVLTAANEEGIIQDADFNYNDNGSLIDLLSMENEGLLALLAEECEKSNPSTENLLNQYHKYHKNHDLFEESEEQFNFTIKHYGGDVTYDVTDFITVNQDCIKDDIIWAFSNHSCNFGFMSFLFNKELKSMTEGPTGNSYRISPPDDGTLRGNLSNDFLENLNNVVKMVMQTKPHFIMCLDSNREGNLKLFDRQFVVSQIRQSQILETVNLMAAGFPHKIRYKAFNDRHKLLLTKSKSGAVPKIAVEETRAILDSYLKLMDEESKMPYVSAHWAFGTKHLFISESCRQQLEKARLKRKEQAATLIQAQWKCRSAVRKWPSVKRQLQLYKQNTPVSRSQRGNVQDISVGMQDIYLDQSPALPPPRNYTIQGNYKVYFPQTRVMLKDFTLHEGRQARNLLSKGQEIKVVGYSDRKGCVKVITNNLVYHVPYQMTQLNLATITSVSGVNI